MDIMKLNSKIGLWFVSKLLERQIKNKTKMGVKVNLRKLELYNDEGNLKKTRIVFSGEIETNSDRLAEYFQQSGLIEND